MATPRNQIESKSVQGEQVGQATRKDGEVLELNIEELEERISPARRPPLK